MVIVYEKFGDNAIQFRAYLRQAVSIKSRVHISSADNAADLMTLDLLRRSKHRPDRKCSSRFDF
jgi:hypothetical protein